MVTQTESGSALIEVSLVQVQALNLSLWELMVVEGGGVVEALILEIQTQGGEAGQGRAGQGAVQRERDAPQIYSPLLPERVSILWIRSVPWPLSLRTVPKPPGTSPWGSTSLAWLPSSFSSAFQEQFFPPAWPGGRPHVGPEPLCHPGALTTEPDPVAVKTPLSNLQEPTPINRGSEKPRSLPRGTQSSPG